MQYNDLLIRATLIVLSLAGLYESLSFASDLLAKRWPNLLPTKKTWFMHLRGSSQDARDSGAAASRWGNLLGFSNCWLGIAFYSLTILAALWTNPLIVGFALFSATVALPISLILIYALLFKLKNSCHLCLIANLANIAIFITWTLAVWLADQIAR